MNAAALLAYTFFVFWTQRGWVDATRATRGSRAEVFGVLQVVLGGACALAWAADILGFLS